MGRNARAAGLALSGVIAIAGCAGTPGTGTGTGTIPTTTTTTTTAPAGDALASAREYRIDLGPVAPCAVGTTCEAQLIVRALAGYHVNADYPTKFVVEAPLTELLDGAPVFSTLDPEIGTMTIRLKPAVAGTTRMTGTFKLALCTGDECKLEAPVIAFDVAAQ